LLYECLGADPMSVAPVSTLGDAEFDQHLRRIGDYGPIRDNADLDYLGIAHGWAGVLYTLLYWCRATGRVPPGEIERRLNELAELGEPTGRGLQWQVRTALPNAATGYMAGWCNGSAGYIHLWSLAHEGTGDDRYLALAERAAWHAWEEPEGIASLCCGLAGRAYGLLRLYRHVQEGAWLRRARDLAARAAAAIASTDAFPDSLYKGKVGVALLAEELSDPSSAAMPLFDTEGWPVSSGRG
jgi:serine/threonine-protein kinase